MNKNLVIVAIVLIVLLAGGLLAYNAYQSNKVTQPTLSNNQTSTPNSNEALTSVTPLPTTEGNSDASTQSAVQTKNTITITSQGFNPPTITIKKGESVTWVNNDTVNHQVNSDNHPTHLLYPILNKVGLIKPSESKSLTFDTAGTYTYHDHLNAALVGKIIVK